MTRRILYALPVILLVAWLLTGVTIVQSNELAVVRRFGRVLDDKPGPGLHLGLPWGIDRIDRVAITGIRKVKVGYDPRAEESERTPAGQLLTGDHNLINAQIELTYTVIAREVVDYVLNADRADGLIARAAEAALAEWVAGRTIDAVLLAGKGELPVWLVSRTQDLLEPYRLGVQVQAVSVPLLSAPDEVKRYFDEVAAAQAEIETMQNKARQDSDVVYKQAKGKKTDIELEAKAYADNQTRKASAEAQAFEARRAKYQQLSKGNPHYVNALWWDEMNKLYARMRENGRLDVLDAYIGPDGLDITQFPLLPKKK